MLIYLASPYTPVGSFNLSQKKLLQAERFEQVCKIAARIMMDCGHQVFSPIAHSHPIELYGKTPSTEGFWLAQDFAILDHCDEMWIATISGWEQSSGVKKEWERAVWHGIPVKLYNIYTGELTNAPNPVPRNDTPQQVCAA